LFPKRPDWRWWQPSLLRGVYPPRESSRALNSHCNAEVVNVWSCTFTTLFAFVACIWTSLSFVVLFLSHETAKVDISFMFHKRCQGFLCSFSLFILFFFTFWRKISHKEVNIAR